MGKHLTNEYLMQKLLKEILNGKLLTNCLQFVTFVNIFPIKILCHVQKAI